MAIVVDTYANANDFLEKIVSILKEKDVDNATDTDLIIMGALLEACKRVVDPAQEIKNFLDVVYPVGSIYTTIDTTFDPNTDFISNTKWSRINSLVTTANITVAMWQRIA